MERISEDVRCWQFRPCFHSKPYTCANKERKLILTSLRHYFIIDTDYLLTEYIRPVHFPPCFQGKRKRRGRLVPPTRIWKTFESLRESSGVNDGWKEKEGGTIDTILHAGQIFESPSIPIQFQFLQWRYDPRGES